MSREGVVIASAIDDNYVWPLLVMLKSAIKGSDRPIKFILGYSAVDLNAKNISILAKVFEQWGIRYEFVELDFDLNVEFDNYLTATTYARLFLADILEEDFLWIDADVMCLPGWIELANLHKKLIGDVAVIGVKDPLADSVPPGKVSRNAALRAAGQNYFNAGVVFISPKNWRELDGPKKWRAAQSSYIELNLDFHDQCILNYVLAGHSYIAAPELNYLVRNDMGRRVADPKIVHFAGGFKPWHMHNMALAVLSPRPHRDLYRGYAILQYQLAWELYKNNPAFARNIWSMRQRLRRTGNLKGIIIQKLRWRINHYRLAIKGALGIKNIPSKRK